MDGFTFFKLLKIHFVCSVHPCIRQGWALVRSGRKEVSGMEPGFLAQVVLNNTMLKMKQYWSGTEVDPT